MERTLVLHFWVDLNNGDRKFVVPRDLFIFLSTRIYNITVASECKELKAMAKAHSLRQSYTARVEKAATKKKILSEVCNNDVIK